MSYVGLVLAHLDVHSKLRLLKRVEDCPWLVDEVLAAGEWPLATLHAMLLLHGALPDELKAQRAMLLRLAPRITFLYNSNLFCFASATPLPRLRMARGTLDALQRLRAPQLVAAHVLDTEDMPPDPSLPPAVNQVIGTTEALAPLRPWAQVRKVRVLCRRNGAAAALLADALHAHATHITDLTCGDPTLSRRLRFAQFVNLRWLSLTATDAPAEPLRATAMVRVHLLRAPTRPLRIEAARSVRLWQVRWLEPLPPSCVRVEWRGPINAAAAAVLRSSSARVLKLYVHMHDSTDVIHCVPDTAHDITISYARVTML